MTARWVLALGLLAQALLVSPSAADDTNSGTPGPLGLAEAVTLAREIAPRSRESVALRAQAEARADVARAPLLPTLRATASYQRRTGNLVFQPSVNSPVLAASAPDPSAKTYNFFAFGVVASQLLYDFGAARETHRDARLRSQRERALGDAVRIDVVRDVRTGFFSLRLAAELVSVAEAYLAHQVAHAERIEAFVEAGTRPEVDRAQIETDVANARIRVVEAERSRILAEAALREAIGLTTLRTFSLDDSALAALPGEERNVLDLYEEALRTDPLLRALTLDEGGADARLAAARAGYAPSLNAVASLTDAGIDLRDLRWNASAGVFLDWPLFEGLRTRAAVTGIDAERTAVRARADAARVFRLRAVSSAHGTLSSAKALHDEAVHARDAARVRLTLAVGRYEAGLGTLIELSAAELVAVEAEARAAQAEVAISLARANLLHALAREE